MGKRIYLCLAHMSGTEQAFIKEAFDTNWVVPLGGSEEFCRRGQGGGGPVIRNGGRASGPDSLRCRPRR